MRRFVRLQGATLILCALAALLALPAGCATGGKGGTAPKAGREKSDKPRLDTSGKYPIPLTDRKYQQCHKNVAEAWKLTELAYLVIKDKYDQAAPEARQAIQPEIEHNVFGVNDTVEQLFLDAIAAEPDNALNYAAYAFYLKPRKRWQTETKYTPTDTEAIEQVDKALELWPDESSFYLLRIAILTEPHQCHDWMRSGAMEELAIASQLPKIRDLYNSAEKYYPENAFINYQRALTIFRFTPPTREEAEATGSAAVEGFDSIRDEVWREIRAGNRKKENVFFFPPPLRAWVGDDTVQIPVLYAGTTAAVYIDHWSQYGAYNMPVVGKVVETLAAPLTWADDREDYFELMEFIYRVGRTQPYDRSYFTVQRVLLDQAISTTEPDSAERLKLATESRFLNDQYRTVAADQFEKGALKDPTKLDVSGISLLESGGSRQMNLRDALQPHQAAYLKHVGDAYRFDFGLPEDPGKW